MSLLFENYTSLIVVSGIMTLYLQIFVLLLSMTNVITQNVTIYMKTVLKKEIITQISFDL